MGNQPDLDPQKSTPGKEPEETEPVRPKFWPLPRFKMGLGRGILDFNHFNGDFNGISRKMVV